MARPASIQKMVTEKPKLKKYFALEQKNIYALPYSPSDWDIECQSLRLPVDGGQRPGDTNTKEHVDSVRSGDVSDGVIGGFVLNSGGLGGEGICG